MRISRGLLIRLAVSFLLLGALWLTAGRAFAQHGCEPGNLIPNCNFDGPFTERGRSDWKLPPAWEPFLVSGSLAYRESGDTYWGAPSLEMVSDGTPFQAGVYTRVSNVTPGVAYRASVGWFAPSHPPDDFFCRKLGIDPNGGTDPTAGSVVWGDTDCGPGRMGNYPRPDTPHLDVSAVAQGTTITVFAFVNHTYSTGVNYIFLDAVDLIADPNQPAAPPPTPTAPPPPPTAVPLQPTRAPATAIRQATYTPQPTATAQPSATPTATHTLVPSPTPTATATWTPLPTETPTLTPTSTLPPRPTATPARPAFGARLPDGGSRAGLLFGGIGALGGAGLLGVAVALVRKK